MLVKGDKIPAVSACSLIYTELLYTDTRKKILMQV
jgi:hypothetical protein